MNKRLKTMLLGISVLALLGGALMVLVLLGPPEEAPGSSEPGSAAPAADPVTLINKWQLDGEDVPDPVKEIRIEGSGTDSIHIVRVKAEGATEDGPLWLTDALDLPCNRDRMDSLVDQLKVIVTERTIDSNPEDIGLYGFDNPLAKVTVTYYDDEVFVFELANLPLSGDAGYYLRVPETGVIYLMDYDLGEAVTARKTAYVGTSLLQIPVAAEGDEEAYPVMTELSLFGRVREEPIRVTLRDGDDQRYNNASYGLTMPYVADCDEDTVSQLTGAITMVADRAVVIHPTQEQLKEYGLDVEEIEDTWSGAMITAKMRKETVDEDGDIIGVSYYGEVNNIVHLGKKNDDGQYYATIVGFDAIFLIDPDQVLWAEMQYSEIVNDFLFLERITDIESLSCRVDGKDYLFHYAHWPDAEKLNDQLIVTLNGERTDTQDMRTLYSVLIKVLRTGKAPQKPSGDPLLSVRLTPIDKSREPFGMDIYYHTVNVYICRLLNGDTYKVSATNVDNAIVQVRRYLAGESVYKN
ncbi:MAG: DUF4340 domain-containing protein [Oscillospiraceae bacterium]|nr:DUF4340 domain-containing protein [Oscillospiraceae bacterium]